MKTKNNKLYNWDHNIETGRREKRLILLPEDENLEVIVGERNVYSLSIIYSCNEIIIGKMILCSNKYSELESHEGDEFIYVLKGKLIVTIYSDEENTNPNSVTKYCYEINKEEKMFIPLGFKHLYKNLDETNVEAIIAIAPNINPSSENLN